MFVAAGDVLKFVELVERHFALAHHALGADQHAFGITVQRFDKSIFRLAMGQPDAQADGDQHRNDQNTSHQADQMASCHTRISFLMC
ncbi:hypothetical protein D3C87_1489590 [compost metagenome]